MIFSQGDPSRAVFHIQKGGVKLTVVSKQGKEAVLAILGGGEFFGQECLAGQAVYMATATAIGPTSVLRVEKSEMTRILREENELANLFVSYLLSRNIRIEEDLLDHLFNPSEQRLARALLQLARFGKEAEPATKDGEREIVIPRLSQETLAEMIGTTRSRVNYFMNKFKKLGLIDYNGGLRLRSALLNAILHD